MAGGVEAAVVAPVEAVVVVVAPAVAAAD
jgi:hypothetical protein